MLSDEVSTTRAARERFFGDRGVFLGEGFGGSGAG